MAYFATMSWRSPSAAKNTAVSLGAPLPAGGAALAGVATSEASNAIADRKSVDRLNEERTTGIPPGLRGTRG